MKGNSIFPGLAFRAEREIPMTTGSEALPGMLRLCSSRLLRQHDKAAEKTWLRGSQLAVIDFRASREFCLKLHAMLESKTPEVW
jgi:hypothetical protein